MQQIQQIRECHELVAGPGLAIAGTETSRIPPNAVPPDSPQSSRRERECTDGTKSQSHRLQRTVSNTCSFHIPSLSGMLYLQGLICHSSKPKSSLLTCVMAVHSTNHALTAVVMILKDRNSLNIKIKMLEQLMWIPLSSSLAFSETWFNSTDDHDPYISALLPDGYDIRHVVREQGKRGGGVALIYKNSIKVICSSSLCYQQFESMILIVTLSINNKTVYRNNSNSTRTKLTIQLTPAAINGIVSGRSTVASRYTHCL